MDWSKDVYGEFEEKLPSDARTPLGKKVTSVHWLDANFMHDVLSGKAVMGRIHYYNKTPIMWYSKKQASSETAAYIFCTKISVYLFNIIDTKGTVIRQYTRCDE